jgi:hypothetical protein
MPFFIGITTTTNSALCEQDGLTKKAAELRMNAQAPPAFEFQRRVFRKVYNGNRKPMRVVVADARERNRMPLHAAAGQKE